MPRLRRCGRRWGGRGEPTAAPLLAQREVVASGGDAYLNPSFQFGPGLQNRPAARVL